MQLSFIVTTYNIEAYTKQCLDSLRLCLREGDQVIIVDDGSTDDTPNIIREETSDGKLGKNVEVCNIFLGVNTIGGVGIPGNIGLDHVTREGVFFVDGDDFLEPVSFNKARDIYEKNPTDILFCNYMEYDERLNIKKYPADNYKWESINSQWPIERQRLKALDLIAVPWRKFYRSSIIKNTRFPEGDFFFEDNPFHWRVCRDAKSISFFNEPICHHRVNRPGQTMASTGQELLAFFTHFETILNEIPDACREHKNLACRWLLNNMTWHLGRLKPEARWNYVAAAHKALVIIPDDIWNGDLLNYFSTKNIWPVAEQLRVGAFWNVLEGMSSKQRDDEIKNLLKRCLDDILLVKKECLKGSEEIKRIREISQARQYIDEYISLVKNESRASEQESAMMCNLNRSAE